MSVVRMPDFIIIGAMKCATTELHEQLARQPGFFMTEPKEPYFFSNDEVWTKGIKWYGDLFKDADQRDLCGESSTHYTKLPTYPETIARMWKHVPDAKLIYIIRDPIDRLVSHYIHGWSERQIKGPIDNAIAQHVELIAYSQYAMQLRPYLQSYGANNILLVFFEHLLAEPQEELERVASFLNYSGKPKWHTSDGKNVSAMRLRKSKWRDQVVWNPVSIWVRRRFIPQSFRDWIKGFWRIKKRPQLSCETRNRLEQIFNEDLAELSSWIDEVINCSTFQTVAKKSMPGWARKVYTDTL